MRMAGIAMVALGIGACDGTAFFPEESAATSADEALYDRGKAAYDAGDFVEARAVFDELWETFPDSERHPKAGYLRGRCRYELGEFSTAIETLGELRATHPASPWEDDARYFAGRSWFELGDFAAAIDDLSRIEADFPASDRVVAARYWIGRARYSRIELDPAYVKFDEVLASSAEHVDDALYYQVRIRADQELCDAANAKFVLLSSAHPASSRVAEAETYLLDAGCDS